MIAAAAIPGDRFAMCSPNAHHYIGNRVYGGSISFGDELQSPVSDGKCTFQSSTWTASTQSNCQSLAAVADREPMYVHLSQFWDVGTCSSLESLQASTAEVSLQAASSGVDTEAKSECSTADTADRSPGSPELERARPRSLQRSQDPVIPEKLQKTEFDSEMSYVPKRPWHSRGGSRAAETKNSDAHPGPLPSSGSAGHRVGRCKPCAFVGTKGCNSGADCRFCHLCEAGEKKKRQKEKRAHFTAIRHARQAQHAQANVQETAQATVISES